MQIKKDLYPSKSVCGFYAGICAQTAKLIFATQGGTENHSRPTSRAGLGPYIWAGLSLSQLSSLSSPD